MRLYLVQWMGKQGCSCYNACRKEQLIRTHGSEVWLPYAVLRLLAMKRDGIALAMQ